MALMSVYLQNQQKGHDQTKKTYYIFRMIDNTLNVNILQFFPTRFLLVVVILNARMTCDQRKNQKEYNSGQRCIRLCIWFVLFFGRFVYSIPLTSRYNKSEFNQV